jgi:hypothetical protein
MAMPLIYSQHRISGCVRIEVEKLKGGLREDKIQKTQSKKTR